MPVLILVIDAIIGVLARMQFGRSTVFQFDGKQEALVCDWKSFRASVKTKRRERDIILQFITWKSVFLVHKTDGNRTTQLTLQFYFYCLVILQDLAQWKPLAFK